MAAKAGGIRQGHGSGNGSQGSRGFVVGMSPYDKVTAAVAWSQQPGSEDEQQLWPWHGEDMRFSRLQPARPGE